MNLRICVNESNENCPVHNGVLKLHVKLCFENHTALLLGALRLAQALITFVAFIAGISKSRDNLDRWIKLGIVSFS